MKSLTLKIILLCSLILSCKKNNLPHKNDYTLEDQLKFTNKILKFYVHDSLVCNNLSNQMDWSSFKFVFYQDEAALLKKYAPKMKMQDIESQFSPIMISESQSEFFPNYKIFNEELVKRSDLLDSSNINQENLYYATLPIFSDDGNIAFVGFSVVMNFLSGHGEVIVFERKGNKWKEVERINLWIN